MINEEKKMERLIEAAIAYADVAQRHLDYQMGRTKMMQEAAALARSGDREAADRKRREVDRSGPVVFDYQDVHQNLIRAVKPFRKGRKKA